MIYPLLQAGKAQTNVWLSAELRTQLDEIAASEGVSLSVVVERLLLMALQAELPPVEGQAPAPQEQPAAAPQEQAPADRAALAQLGHELLAGGLTAASIADQFNAKGWTPNKVPKAVGVKPRSDSPAAWTPKLISQLLLRDHPAQPDREAAP